MNGKKNILFIYNHLSSFIRKDLDILAAEFNITSHDFYTPSKAKTPLRLVSQKLFLLKNIWKADLIVCQFAGYHSLLPALFGKVFRKPCLIIVGGTDAHYFPKIGYGNFQKRFLKTFTALSFKLCTHIAPKHHSLMFCEYKYDEQEPARQGIYARMPKLKTPFTEITNGYNVEQWKCTKEKKKNTFITVSGGWEYPFQQQLKGIDLILEVAPFFPDCEFIILGVPKPETISVQPLNVKLLPPFKNENLANVYSEFEFYLQLSMAEGFPNSICEAMLCECIPIGSDVFSIPEIIGDSGFILTRRSADDLKLLIEQAIICDRSIFRSKARKKIADNYGIDIRKEKLIRLSNNLIKA